MTPSHYLIHVNSTVYLVDNAQICLYKVFVLMLRKWSWYSCWAYRNDNSLKTGRHGFNILVMHDYHLVRLVTITKFHVPFRPL